MKMPDCYDTWKLGCPDDENDENFGDTNRCLWCGCQVTGDSQDVRGFGGYCSAKCYEEDTYRG